MHRFYVPPTESHSPQFVLPEAESKHAVQVLRLQAGDKLQVLDGAGRKCECVILRAEKRGVLVESTAETLVAYPRMPVAACIPLAKGKAMDLMIQKATELGAMRIAAISTERCVAQVDEERAEDKVAKWRQTAIEAAKQSGREWLPEITAPMTLKHAVEGLAADSLNLVAALLPQALPVRQQFLAYTKTHGQKPAKVSIWVGPEGDFSPSEYDFLLRSALLPVSLGSHVLRCETALISLLAICQQEVLDLT
jgi:16S rRNA (uracil1498-N3)-methyltransferase